MKTFEDTIKGIHFMMYFSYRSDSSKHVAKRIVQKYVEPLQINIDKLEAENKELEKDNEVLTSALFKLEHVAYWAKAILEDMECRMDEDCDHCHGEQLLSDLRG